MRQSILFFVLDHNHHDEHYTQTKGGALFLREFILHLL